MINSVAIVPVTVVSVTAKYDMERQLLTRGVTNYTVYLVQTDARGHILGVSAEYTERNQEIMRAMFGTVNTVRTV